MTINRLCILGVNGKGYFQERNLSFDSITLVGTSQINKRELILKIARWSYHFGRAPPRKSLAKDLDCWQLQRDFKP